jgi:hypothetical protein
VVDLLDWCPPPAEKPPGFWKRLYTSREVSGAVWGLLILALAGSLLLSALESSREARELMDQMDRLREDIRTIHRRTELIKHGRQ